MLLINNGGVVGGCKCVEGVNCWGTSVIGDGVPMLTRGMSGS